MNISRGTSLLPLPRGLQPTESPESREQKAFRFISDLDKPGKGEHDPVVWAEVQGKLFFPHKILCGKALCGPPQKSGILLKFPCLLWGCMSVMQIQRLSSGLGGLIHLKARTGDGRQCSADQADSNLHGGLLLACSEQQEAKGGGGMVWQITALSFECLR